MTSAGHLVLIDDDPHVLSALRFAFETEGYDVRTCASGEEVLATPPNEPATCLVIDQRLPGMSGLETLARLRAQGVCAPAILITTNPSNSVVRCAAAANVDIVEKPLLGDVLTKKVRAALQD